MNCKGVKIIYNDLQHRKIKAEKKIYYIDSRLKDIADIEQVSKLSNELTEARSKQRVLIVEISKLERQYTFLKTKGQVSNV